MANETMTGILMEMRAEFRAFHAELDSRFEAVDVRLDAIEREQEVLQEAFEARLNTSKFITGDFEERIGALEKKVDELAKRR